MAGFSEIGISVEKRFEEKLKNDSKIKTILAKIDEGKADMNDMSEYSRRLGHLARQSIYGVYKEELNDRPKWSDVQYIVENILRQNYDNINELEARVQKSLDSKAGIGLKPLQGDFPAERVSTVIGAASNAENAEQAIRRMCSPTENITASFHADYVKKNTEFRSKAGLSCYIERTTDGKCCDWCSKLAGRYRYPDEVPKDVYRRHDNCTCDVSYVSEKGRRNVHTQQLNWSKEKNLEYLKQLDAEKKAKRAEYKANGKNLQKVRFKPSESAARRERIEYAASVPKPMKLTKAEAIAKESEILAQRRLTYDRKRGIINTRDIASRNLPNGLRTAPNHILTDDEILSLKKDIEAIGADLKIFKFNSGRRTGYDDVLDEIRVKGDILPDLNSNHPRDRMSSRAALAHEYYGHRANRGTKLPNGAWNDEFRASYMAAKNCPNLSDEERRDLILDALERAKEKGITIRNNDFIRRTLYGY